jgi:hypothetical protein
MKEKPGNTPAVYLPHIRGTKGKHLMLKNYIINAGSGGKCKVLDLSII